MGSIRGHYQVYIMDKRKTSKTMKHKVKKVGSVAGIIMPSKRVEEKIVSPFNLL
jgi:hypothetical protein